MDKEKYKYLEGCKISKQLIYNAICNILENTKDLTPSTIKHLELDRDDCLNWIEFYTDEMGIK